MNGSERAFISDTGGFTRLDYDSCAYQKKLCESTSPLQYRMYQGYFENNKKCIFNKDSFYYPYSESIVDTDSELKGLGRIATRCPNFKYKPTCKRSSMCVSTFDKSVPIVMPQEVCYCDIVKNNIPKMTNPGYVLDPDTITGGRLLGCQ